MKFKCEVCGTKLSWLQLQLAMLKIPTHTTCNHCKTIYAVRHRSMILNILLICTPLLLHHYNLVFVNTASLLIYVAAFLLLLPFLVVLVKVKGR